MYNEAHMFYKIMFKGVCVFKTCGFHRNDSYSMQYNVFNQHTNVV